METLGNGSIKIPIKARDISAEALRKEEAGDLCPVRDNANLALQFIGGINGGFAVIRVPLGRTILSLQSGRFIH